MPIDFQPESGIDFQEDEKIDLSRMPQLSPEVAATMARDNPSLALQAGIALPPIGPEEGFLRGQWEQANTRFKEIPRVEGATSTIGKIGQGAANVGIGIAEGLETPLGVATLGVGMLPKIAQRAIALGFGGAATKASAEKLGEASVTGDVGTATEGVLTGALVPFLARPAVRTGEGVMLTKGDALRSAARDLDRATLSKEPLNIPESIPVPIRELGVQVPRDPFLNPGVREIASRALSDAQGREILLPGQEAPLAQLRRVMEPPTIEGVEINQRMRPGGGPAEGGKISFAGEASAKAIPSARQSAIQVPEIVPPATPKPTPAVPEGPIAKLESELNVPPGKLKATNNLTKEVGMQLRSIDELNQVEAMFDSATKDFLEAKGKGDFSRAMELALKRQYLRETIETATNTGSTVESSGVQKLGKRPLDVDSKPDVKSWLSERADKFGIEYKPEPASPAELPAPATGTTRLYQGSGGSAGAGQGGAYWSANPDYARSFGPKVEYIDVPTKDLAAYDVRKLEGSGTPGTYKLPPEVSKGAKAHPEISEKVFDLDTPEGLLDRLDNKLAEVQSNIRSGKTFTGVTGLEPVMLDAAIVAARAAIKATKSVKAGIDAAVAYIKEKFPNAKFNPDELAEWVNKNASESVRTAGTESRKVSATLDDVYKIFEPEPEPTTSIREKASGAIEAVRTGLSSKFRPIDKLAEDIAKHYGLEGRKIAGVFEALKGSSGKGEADIYRFDRSVSDLVKSSEKDFNAYMFLRRGLDRLRMDAETGEGRRKVGNFTPEDLQAKLDALSSKLGVEKISQFQKAADNYQAAMDQALRLQVESGRMSPELFRAIKDGNQFYAPFKVMKYIEDSFKAEGSGAKIDTTADFAKKMEGIESGDFKLGDMLGAARQNILLSRILADKNLAMRKISDLAATDVDGVFIRKVAEGADAPKGMELVNVMENGKVQKYAVDPSVAESVQVFAGKGSDIVTKILSGFGTTFRAGATTFNLPFQISNLMADVPRQALVSKYGIRGMSDLVRFPLDLAQSLFTSIEGTVFGRKNKLFLDFLDSGTAGATVQEYLTPAGLKFQEPTNISRSKKLAKTVLNTIPDFAQAIEQTSKIMGVKRAMRFEGVESGAQLAKQIPEAITEIRRFSGSPDFGRQGRWVEGYRLNLLYMFLNARIQGTTADLGRLIGRDGAGTAARTWGKIGTAVGLPTAYLYNLNNSEEFAEDYAKRPDQEKANYWLIPKDSFITTESGEKIRDYWRIPKRESAKWIANMVESGLSFAEKRDPETFASWAQQMAEDVSPVNIQGDTFQERIESVGASMNPIIKAPLEAATGRDMYRHKSIVPDAQKKASPENQYTDRTPSVFKTLADIMPDVAPELLRSPLMLENMSKNLTAGMFSQFIPKKPVEGRSAIENNPLLQRFQALPFTDSSEFDEKISQYERESADAQLARFRAAHDLMQANKGKDIREIAKDLVQKHGPDEKLMERVADMWIADRVGVSSQERRILNLPVQQRAQFIASEIANASPEEKGTMLRDFARKRILTESVAEELIKVLPEAK